MKHLVSAAFLMVALITPTFASGSSGAVCKPAQGTDASKVDYPIGFTGLGIKNTSSDYVLPIVCPINESLDPKYVLNTTVVWTAPNNNPSAQIVCALKGLSQSNGGVVQSQFGSLKGSGALRLPQSGITSMFVSLDCQLPPGGTLNTIWVNDIGT
ncbi:MAG: hypothetical protein JOY85_13010 [Acidobacteriaceae bacterium]|nr:hypothetical protein [Acidobacteriaceae bacterium]